IPPSTPAARGKLPPRRSLFNHYLSESTRSFKTYWLPAGAGTFCPTGAVAGPFLTPNAPTQNTNRIVNQKNSTLNEIMVAPNPIVWVKAHGELSRMISLTCQNNRTDDRM